MSGTCRKLYGVKSCWVNHKIPEWKCRCKFWANVRELISWPSPERPSSGCSKMSVFPSCKYGNWGCPNRASLNCECTNWEWVQTAIAQTVNDHESKLRLHKLWMTHGLGFRKLRWHPQELSKLGLSKLGFTELGFSKLRVDKPWIVQTVQTEPCPIRSCADCELSDLGMYQLGMFPNCKCANWEFLDSNCINWDCTHWEFSE